MISLEVFLETEVDFYSTRRSKNLILFQRHKLGANLTPVTLETFAIWKKTRMDKKEAEADALRKTKEVQHAAGKITGMSGRDLVSPDSGFDGCVDLGISSNTTQSGSKIKTMEMSRTTSISLNTDAMKRNYTRSFGRRSKISVMCIYMKTTMRTRTTKEPGLEQLTSSPFFLLIFCVQSPPTLVVHTPTR